jgi:peptidoglycan/xylan/chitin deacetylase (PgdA/CDA1 family)
MSERWPGNTRCVVTLSFDIDGVSSYLFQNREFARFPSLMSMAEFGPSVAVPRILDLLDGRGVHASFFIPGYVAETHPDMVREIADRGHEVGHHGYLHEPPANLTPVEEARALDRGTEIIRGLIGAAPRGYRSPSWELSEDSLEFLAERGFIYDSSLMGDVMPYWVDAGAGHQLVELPIHWEWDDFPYFGFAPAVGARNAPSDPEVPFNVWKAGFDAIHETGEAFNLTMHPHQIGRPARLAMLDRLIEYMQTRPDVAFMRCEDVASWVADGTVSVPMRNPLRPEID